MRLLLAASLFCALAIPALAQPLTSAFTYQGELTENGSPVGGTFDLEFRLFDSAGGATQVGPTLCSDNLAVSGGRFTVLLDFGAQFNAQSRHLEVRVRPDTGLACGDATGLSTLTPRQSLTAAPAASFALTSAFATTADAATNTSQLNGQPASFYTNAANLTGILPGARLSGTYASALTLSNASNMLSGNGAALTALNAANIATGVLPNARTTGTAANTPSTLVLRDASGGFAAGIISATYTGNGAGITSLNADNVSSGLLSPARGGTGANTAAASNGQVLKWNGVAWAPGLDLDTNTTYTAGNGLALSGTTFALSTAGATTGEVMKFNGTTWNAEPDTDTNTTYTAGAGLSLTGTTFAIAASGVSGGTAGVITDNTITNADLAADTASLAKITNSNLAVSGANIVAANNITADEFNYTAPATSYQMVPCSSFVSRDSCRFTYGGAAIPWDTSVDGLMASLILPHGCTITAVRFYVYDNHSIDMTCRLYEQVITTNNGNFHATLATTGTSTLAQVLTATGLNVPVNSATSAFSLLVTPSAPWGGDGMYIRAARVDYTMPRPAR
jgi:hypothetical protein